MSVDALLLRRHGGDPPIQLLDLRLQPGRPVRRRSSAIPELGQRRLQPLPFRVMGCHRPAEGFGLRLDRSRLLAQPAPFILGVQPGGPGPLELLFRVSQLALALLQPGEHVRQR